ncbi:MAG: class I SAM-dependent methyltransferase [Erysipelotrichaceae bacterium]|nr:class I SAM-dependent methyltransferase [Erysipelotrichaceae bacterium]
MYWNHNSAYYPWVKKKTADCHTILDVGCGDGSLALFLDDGVKKIVGIDTDSYSIGKALLEKNGENLTFTCCSFENYIPDMKFDAIVFAASIHHMDMTQALKKARSLLSSSGKILIVGIAKPSTITDWALEIFRVLPSKILSALHHMHTSEELKLTTSYDFSEMNVIRSIVRKELPGAEIHYGLHYRYLVEWSE